MNEFQLGIPGCQCGSKRDYTVGLRSFDDGLPLLDRSDR
jgi:hypothetical protein